LAAVRIGDYEYVFIDQPQGWFGPNEFWRFVFVQQQVAKLRQTAIDFPPMQPSASFKLSAVKKQIDKAITSITGQYRLDLSFFWRPRGGAAFLTSTHKKVMSYLPWEVIAHL
jgi:hypothetical protein